MSELKQLMDHHTFIVRSDRKSLFTQIKNLVNQAQEVASKELEQRRRALKSLLEDEDQIYEEEFANKVKSRIDEDIQERKDILLKIKEESTKNELEFLKSKRIQQYMNSCYEIREALRRQDMQIVKECQLEQILEKERSMRKEQEMEKYWKKVQQTNIDRANAAQQEENCLKKNLVTRIVDTLKIQQQELEEKREKERAAKLEEKKKIDALLEEIRLEKFDRKLQGTPTKVIEYRNELLKTMTEKEVIRKKEDRELSENHRQMMMELRRIENEDTIAVLEKKKAFHKATLDFIQHVKCVRDLEQQQQDAFNARIDNLRRIDICTKNNILREKQRKARIAEQCYAELRKQICEQYEKRLREEAEYRECKILENRFIHQEITPEQILEKKRKYRQDLDKQIEEIKKIRESEESKFSHSLNRASNDPEFCAELAEQYIREGIDYLEPHANWRILACPSKEYIPKQQAYNGKDFSGKVAISKKCFEPCGCIAPIKAGGYQDGRGDEAK